MNEIDIVNLDEVASILGDKVLSDKDFSKSGLVNAVVDKPVDIDAVSFSFGASANFNVQLFNSEDDLDEDNVVSSKPAGLLAPSSTRAWLKYQVKSDLRASAGIELGKLGFDIKGEKSVIFNSYRLHEDLSQKLRSSVIADFQPFFFIANLAHVKALKPDEVLSMRLPGKLSVSVTVAWSDIFTGSLSLLQKLLPAGEILNFELSASAKVSFNVEVEDDLSLQIRKNAADLYEVFVNKTSNKELGVGFEAGIEVGFQDPDAANKVLGAVTEGLTGKLKGKVQAILDKNPLDKLNDTEKEIVTEVAAALGVGINLPETVSDLQNVLTQKVAPVVSEIAKSRIKFGFAYEYNRISASKVIFQAKLTGAALAIYHAGLVRFKLEEGKGFKGIVTDLRAAELAGKQLDGVELVNYLNEKTVVTRQAWGFSLGIGKWTLAGKDHIDSTEVVRENVQGNTQVAIEGTRGYDGNLFGDEHNWTVDFNAEMERFSQNRLPLVNELKYSLYLLMEWKRKNNFSEENIRHITDQAVLWKVLEEEQYDTVFKELSDLLTGDKIKNVHASVHLKLPPDIFQLIFNNLTRVVRDRPLVNIDLIAKSMAAAMTRLEDSAVRKTVDSRINVYAPLWKACLLKPNKSENNSVIGQEERMDLAFAAKRRLLEFNEKAMARQETDFANSPSDVRFSSLLAMNTNVRADWGAFKDGITTLSNGFTQGLIYKDVVRSSFKSMQFFWGQDHYVRTLGHYLLSFANNDILMEKVERSLTISYDLNGESKVINMIGKAR